MIMNSKGKEFHTKQEGDLNDSSSKYSRSTASTSRQWAGFRNPRIVRVSRSFGGKDRHSKVCTVRGLRDRRIRLSVPTAIQLYDLQDRLGLSQPSKVVDWLLDATKTEIDKLPPLQMPPGNFNQFHQAIALSSHHQHSLAAAGAAGAAGAGAASSLPHFFNANQPFFSSKEGIRINDQTILDRSSRYWNPEAASSARKEAEREGQAAGKDKWIVSNDHHENQGGLEGSTFAAQLTAQNFFPIGNQSSFPTLLNNAALPAYNPFYHWEASNLSLSQLGSHSNIPIQTAEDSNTIHNTTPMAIPSGSHLYFCPPAPTLPTMVPSFPSYMAAAPVENDARQINHFQFLSSNSQPVQPNSLMPTLHLISSPMKSFRLNVNPEILRSQENNSSSSHVHPHKGGAAS